MGLRVDVGPKVGACRVMAYKIVSGPRDEEHLIVDFL